MEQLLNNLLIGIIIFLIIVGIFFSSYFFGKALVLFFKDLNKEPINTLNVYVTGELTVNAKDLMFYCKKYPTNNFPKVTNIPEPPKFRKLIIREYVELIKLKKM